MKLRSIQALRAIAALAVMGCHLRAIEHKHLGDEALLSDTWINGASGVDIFFVISGFVMVWVTANTPNSARQSAAFLFARITRIYPLWWLFSGAMATYFLVTYGVPWDANRLMELGMTGPEHLWKSALLIPQRDFPVLDIGWTLIHEMYFYVIFAAFIFVSPARWRPLLLLLWAVFIIAAGLQNPAPGHAGNLVALVMFPMTLEFILGGLIAYIIGRGITGLALPCFILGGALYTLVFMHYSFIDGGGSLLAWMQLDNPAAFTLSWGRTICFGLPAGLIVYGLVSLEMKRGWGEKIPTFMVALGDWSYGLYLCHILVLSLIARLIFPYLSGPPVVESIAFILIASAVTIAVAALTYRLFERPLIGMFKNSRRRIAGPPK